MTAVYYADRLVTEYVDGTEEVRFTDDEFAAMLRDPVYFGLAAPCGHRVREDDPFYVAEGCPKCFVAAEYGEAPPPSDFPVIRCGHCGGEHVGTGAVYRCSRTGTKWAPNGARR